MAILCLKKKIIKACLFSAQCENKPKKIYITTNKTLPDSQGFQSHIIEREYLKAYTIFLIFNNFSICIVPSKEPGTTLTALICPPPQIDIRIYTNWTFYSNYRKKYYILINKKFGCISGKFLALTA